MISREFSIVVTMLEFKDLKRSGLADLDSHLAERSFVSGYEASQNDVSVFRAVPVNLPDDLNVGHVRRWQAHMKTYTQTELKSLPVAEEHIKVVVPQETPRKEVRPPCISLMTSF